MIEKKKNYKYCLLVNEHNKSILRKYPMIDMIVANLNAGNINIKSLCPVTNLDGVNEIDVQFIAKTSVHYLSPITHPSVINLMGLNTELAKEEEYDNVHFQIVRVLKEN